MHVQDPTHPTGISDDTPQGNSEVARARDRKAASAIQLRIAGASWDEVAEVLGFPTARAAIVATERALEKELQTTESQDAMRKMAGKRLDRLLRAVWGKALDPDHPEQLAAVRTAREIVGQHSKLFGLDAPTEHVIHSPSESEIAQWVASVTVQQRPQLEEADIFEMDDVIEGEVVDAVPAE
jgi:hypothetical protein